MVLKSEKIRFHNSDRSNITNRIPLLTDQFNSRERSGKGYIFVKPACGKARHSCYNFCKVCKRACVRPDLSGP